MKTRIPFTKAHGAKNDFLLTWADQVRTAHDERAVARAICDRHTGVGADGWILLYASPGRTRIRLYNQDGSDSEISGNGTRCAAALMVAQGKATDVVEIETGAGIKRLSLLERRRAEFWFEMDMGPVEVEELQASVEGWDATILRVGNPQCAVLVDSLEFDWVKAGEVLESHQRFPARSNVSFVHVVNRHRIQAVFYERGVGPTLSSGTGSAGAAMAAHARGLVDSPVEIATPAGVLRLRLHNGTPHLTGPAEIVAEGLFLYQAG
jgi:diaminopimelate epimerase